MAHPGRRRNPYCAIMPLSSPLTPKEPMIDLLVFSALALALFLYCSGKPDFYMPRKKD